MTNKIRAAAFSAASAVALAAASTGHAQSVAFPRPNLTTSSGAVSVGLNGSTFVNQGLVGVGRLSANTRDFAGETLGSFSGMALDLGSWRRNANGSYAGKMFTLPDRGPNDVGPFVGTTDYRNRVHTHDLVLTPYTGAVNLPATTASQSQLQITPTGGFILVDSTGVPFTGKDGGSNVITRNGVRYPSPATGEGAGRISLDSEAIGFRPDGSFYISDEYAPGIYYFDKTGRQLGAIQSVGALLPITAGALNFDSAAPPTTGRRNNQGLEALALTPDGNKLVTILQSATVQDTNGANQQTRNNTRILVYDISANPLPAAPVAHYVLQLPVFNQDGSGAAPNRTAAQSEMLALNDSQFLVLARDGVGRGSTPGASTTPIYKSVLLVDTTGATNLAGTAFETGTTPIATAGTLASSIVPVRQVELVNMLNPVQLSRFGMNLNVQPSDILSVSEKWEAMGLAPALEETAPQDFFLLVGNDNDFQSTTGRINGQDYNAGISGPGGTGQNDSVMLVYRLTLPTYVDPIALASLKADAPLAVAAARATVAAMGTAAATAGLESIASLRYGGWPAGAGVRLWAQGNWAQVEAQARGASPLSADGAGAAAGVDIALGGGRIGVSVGYQSLDGKFGRGELEGDGLAFGVYGGLAGPNGLFVQAAYGVSASVDLARITRPGPYGLTAVGQAEGSAHGGAVELGWTPAVSPSWRIGPVAGVEYAEADLDAYVETGASLGNVAVPDLTLKRTRISLGMEAYGRMGPVFPSFRLSYVFESATGDKSAPLKLASANHAMATAVVAIPGFTRNHIAAAVGFQGQRDGLDWRVGLEGRFGGESVDGRLVLGLSKRF